MEGANKSMRRELHNFGYWVLLFCAYTLYQKYGSPNSVACEAAAPYNIMIDIESKSIRSVIKWWEVIADCFAECFFPTARTITYVCRLLLGRNSN